MQTFLAAHKYILRDSFAYSFIITMLRASFALNRVEGFVRGRHFNYFATFEGQDVLRFFCVLYTVTSASVIDELRGGEMTTEKRNAKHKGCFDLRNTILPGIPSPRQLRKYIATPYSIGDMITISQPLVNAAALVFLQAKLETNLLGVTLDCVYGEPRAEVVTDLGGQAYVVA